MELETTVSKIEDVEEQYRGLYEEQEAGGFKLKISVKGTAPKEKVEEFRGNNLEKQQRIEELEQQLKDIESSKKEATMLEAGDAQKIIDELKGLNVTANQELETYKGKVTSYEEREKVKLAAVVEQLPEEMRGKYDTLDVGVAIGLAEDMVTALASKKPFGIPPKEVGKMVVDDDLSNKSGAELLQIHRQQGKGA